MARRRWKGGIIKEEEALARRGQKGGVGKEVWQGCVGNEEALERRHWQKQSVSK